MARTVHKQLPPEEARNRFLSLAQSEQQHGRFGKAAEFFELANAWGDAAANYGRIGDTAKEQELWVKARQELGGK